MKKLIYKIYHLGDWSWKRNDYEKSYSHGNIFDLLIGIIVLTAFMRIIFFIIGI